jgi:hypothetical protein
MTTIAILAMVIILGGIATLSVTVVSPVAAQTPTGDNTSMT